MFKSLGICGIFLFLFGVLFSGMFISEALAHAIESETSVGKNRFSQMFFYDGDMEADALSHWIWNLGFQYSRATFSDPAVFNKKITDNTYHIKTGFGYDSKWLGGISFDFAKTPEEKLMSIGPQFYVGKNLDELFSTLRIKAIGGFRTFSQGIETQSRRTAVTTRNAVKIIQSSIGLRASFDPAEWAALSMGYTHYLYSRNVALLLNSLDSKEALSRNISSLSSTLSNLSKNAIEISSAFYFLRHMEFDFDGVLSKLEGENRWVASLRTGVRYDILQNWTLGAAFERAFNGTANEPDENLFSGSLAFRF
jgi:hypothetical protein